MRRRGERGGGGGGGDVREGERVFIVFVISFKQKFSRMLRASSVFIQIDQLEGVDR